MKERQDHQLKPKIVWIRFCGILPHLNIALSLLLLTLFITDRFNRAMSFINNEQTRWLLLAYCLLLLMQIFLPIRRKQAIHLMPFTVLCLICTVGFLTVLMVDRADRSLGVLNIEWIKWILCLYSILTIVDAVCLIRYQRRKFRSERNGEVKE